jgi:hypothetical protein
MSYLLVDTVRIDNLDEARKGLHSGLIPFVTQLDGFIRGTWAADPDTGRGIGTIVFDTLQHAEAAHELMKAGTPPQGITPEGIVIYEIQGEA